MKTALQAAGALLALTLIPTITMAQETPRDGSHDFDWEFGTWNTHVLILAEPLSGKDEWIEMTGTTVVHKMLDGKMNLAELKVSNEKSRIDGVSLRVYNPNTGEWSLYYANARTGVLDKPVVGGFKGKRGEFYAQDTYRGRSVFVRFVITPTADGAWRFEQSFSADGGVTWETNWIATDTPVEATP